MKQLACLLLAVLLLSSLWAQKPATFFSNTNVVVVNVTVLDRQGHPIENLTKDDFLLVEDGKVQKLQAVDLQRLENKTLPPMDPQFTPRPQPAPKGYNPDADKAAKSGGLLSQYQDRRLVVLLFDFSSMEAAEQVRAKKAAEQFIRTQMTASDEVSIETYTSQLQTTQPFTSDRDLLIAAIEKLRIGDSSENAATADTGADSQDTSGQFTADETEFNIFNADLKLAALQDAARSLGQYPEKKALVYISSGIQKSGVDNQSQLRATVNTAVRANVAFYPIDARGLTALVPGGDVTQQGAVGTGLMNGSGQRSLRENFDNSQETLATLAIDTGGKALLDSNDLTGGMRQVQSDFTSYYVLSYVSTNPAADGRYRRIQVKLAPKDQTLRAKLDYRQGYYAQVAFRKLQDEDKEAQLSQALLSENPLTDLPVAAEVDFFRLEKDKYFVPISVKIPGSALQFEAKGKRQSTELDFIAEIYDARNHPAQSVRDTIPLKLDQTTAGQVVQKNIQYDTGVTLASGSYRLRFVARENGGGKIGTFEANFKIPNLGTQKILRLSSLVVSNQMEPVTQQVAGVKNDKKLLDANPLLSGGQKMVPNVTKVFRPGQNLRAYLEVYDPTIPDFLPENRKFAAVTASLALYAHDKKVFESPPVNARQLEDKRAGVLPVRFSVPLAGVAPGQYECQVTLVDQFGKKFGFSRTRLAVVKGNEPAVNK